tara:strand:+ start:1225 stop:1884 length:660 start_codon:yes stop_codon:yes gene_type:complete
MKTEVIITKEDLALSGNGNVLNEQQLGFLLKKTPAKYIMTRPAKGGGSWEYVSGGYVKKALNLMFGWNWNFEIISKEVIDDEAIVHGRLTVTSNGITIYKEQFGNKDVIYRKQSDAEKAKGLAKVPLSRGNDLKSAATDCLKKCASELGIAADLYAKLEFRETTITPEVEIQSYLAKIEELHMEKFDSISDSLSKDINRVVKNKETSSYIKIIKALEEL